MAQAARMRYVIAYDVADDGKRTKLAHVLLDYGERVQKSVFEADLAPKDVEELLAKIANYLAAEDSLRLYPLCRACARAVKTRGRLPLVEPQTWRIL